MFGLWRLSVSGKVFLCLKEFCNGLYCFVVTSVCVNSIVRWKQCILMNVEDGMALEEKHNTKTRSIWVGVQFGNPGIGDEEIEPRGIGCLWCLVSRYVMFRIHFASVHFLLVSLFVETSIAMLCCTKSVLSSLFAFISSVCSEVKYLYRKYLPPCKAFRSAAKSTTLSDIFLFLVSEKICRCPDILIPLNCAIMWSILSPVFFFQGSTIIKHM